MLTKENDHILTVKMNHFNGKLKLTHLLGGVLAGVIKLITSSSGAAVCMSLIYSICLALGSGGGRGGMGLGCRPGLIAASHLFFHVFKSKLQGGEGI